MLKVSTGLGVIRFFKRDLLEFMCLEFTGGGFTAQQTIEAMNLRAAISEGKPVTIKYKGVTLTFELVDENPA